jgi:hypothetical protein
MRIASLAMVGAVTGVWMLSNVQAEDRGTPQLRQPTAVQKTAFEYDNVYYAQAGGAAPSPSDQPLLSAPKSEPAPEAGKVTAGDTPSNANCCPSCCCDPGKCGCSSCCDPNCGDPKPWTMPQIPWLQKLGIKSGGWLEQGYNSNGHGRGYGFNGPAFCDDWNGEYQMNQLWLYFDRPVKTDGCGWDIGGHVDVMYGTDWRFGVSNGLENRINAYDWQSYGMVIPQFYLQVAYNNLSIKFGHMDDLMGYENVPAVMNPLYSHSYAFVFGEPILVTGMVAEYKLTDQFTVVAGLSRGWMMFEDNNGALDFIGGWKWTSASKRLSLDYMVDVGPQDADGHQDRFVHAFVGKYKVTEPLEYVLQQNYGIQHNCMVGATPVGDGQWYGIDQYLLYALNPRLKLVGRFEWFRDDDGVRVFGPPDAAGVRMWSGDSAAPGFAGNFYEMTAGVNWRPHPNFLFRPEVRWDWYEGSRNIAGQLPFNGGRADNQFLFGIDMVVTY